ncbi:MAG TPA: DUF3341 domain-containing protein [Kiritimatiellia bacterium]|nr:DUF3341 domain-containing protein [Kiritimatiellia bacterium]HMP35077.1 DUF3341 domain-containing protein [Kiritimatiellia bacterium]
MKQPTANSMYGMVAEFHDTETLLKAANLVREAGYTATDAFSPIPVHGLVEALGIRRSRLAGIVLCGGLAGAATGFALQTYLSVFQYPHVVSGRPLFSWPSFVPIIFELTILFSAFAAVFGMFGLNGLPKPYDPVFNTPGFNRASTDGFFLCIQSNDPKYDPAATRALLEKAGAVQVTEVAKHPDDPE